MNPDKLKAIAPEIWDKLKEDGMVFEDSYRTEKLSEHWFDDALPIIFEHLKPLMERPECVWEYLDALNVWRSCFQNHINRASFIFCPDCGGRILDSEPPTEKGGEL